MMALASLVLVLLNSCATSVKNSGDPYVVKATEEGKASWYSIKTNRGTKTASGQKLCNHAPTAAHKTLPMGTKVRVINLANNKSEVVTINDRGPFKKGRVIDVTIGTAEKLGFVQRGIVPVRVEVLSHKDEE
jgi:rare lipoprotein A